MAITAIFNGDKVRTKVEKDSAYYNLKGVVRDYSEHTDEYVVDFGNSKRGIFKREELRKLTPKKDSQCKI